ncbi:disulfide bond formation protein B [Pseudoruegeria sp. SHC-113]|uniref:disulfide bond formation protein B n=1 Tax=Pseudoruegeria sp. SHC-113 TaxID=2855439 RepID=UPI0021BAF8EF|nr:disulfide bond formation protein B [Pseudoruegeria sp. SHC-113]MCT8160496.1 disulfide bond formation protein B [Pseudoruegeria sp. SHC-113]
MTRKTLGLIAAAGSAALLIGAFGFQFLGYAPCKMCLWQRWPHAAAILFGAALLAFGGRVWTLLGALAAFATGAIGVYHTGVERGFWEGPSSCTGGGTGLSGLSGADLLSTAGSANIVMCDEVAWAMFGLSMASWNALASFALCALWIAAFRAPESR